MKKEIYLVKCEGYCYKYSDGGKSIFNTVYNYHCYEDLEKAKNEVRSWQKEERAANKRLASQGKDQVWHNYKVEIIGLY